MFISCSSFNYRVLFATVHDANRAQVEAYWGTEKNERLHIVAPYLSELGPKCNAQCVKEEIEMVISQEADEEQWLGLQVSEQIFTLRANAVHSDEKIVP